MNAKKTAILLAHALVGWALCGAIIGIGFSIWTVQTTLVVHAVGAPIVFVIVSWIYFRRFGFTTPLQTALVFLASAMLLDATVVSLIILRSFEMFVSPIGTWVPFALIFLSTWLIGWLVTRGRVDVAMA